MDPRRLLFRAFRRMGLEIARFVTILDAHKHVCSYFVFMASAMPYNI
jgi:hypothetical protein